MYFSSNVYPCGLVCYATVVWWMWSTVVAVSTVLFWQVVWRNYWVNYTISPWAFYLVEYKLRHSSIFGRGWKYRVVVMSWFKLLLVSESRFELRCAFRRDGQMAYPGDICLSGKPSIRMAFVRPQNWRRSPSPVVSSVHAIMRIVCYWASSRQST